MVCVCRLCSGKNIESFMNLGAMPPANELFPREQNESFGINIPLKIFVCKDCLLVQTEDYLRSDEVFKSDYCYLSSVSSSWVAHAKQFITTVAGRFELDYNSFIVEVACNDGYLLQHAIALNIPCLGVEPTEMAAHRALEKGIPVEISFFGKNCATKLRARGVSADLVVANNVLAHVPDLRDFVRGIAIILKTDGVASFEFQHLLNIIQDLQFDTLYHEHFSYFSLFVVSKLMESESLKVFDAEELDTHGGSLRIWVTHRANESLNVRSTSRVENILQKERNCGLSNLAVYRNFQSRADLNASRFLKFLKDQRAQGKVVVGYGAAAKASTLLNYLGVRDDLLPFVYDASPSKYGKRLPGSGIEIRQPSQLFNSQPDFVVIFPWNLAEEILQILRPKLSPLTRYIVTSPELRFV